MKEYEVEIIETLTRVVTIDAENADEALSLVWDKYSEGYIVLDESDHVDTDLNIFEG